jgi:hypothetical protein
MERAIKKTIVKDKKLPLASLDLYKLIKNKYTLDQCQNHKPQNIKAVGETNT